MVVLYINIVPDFIINTPFVHSIPYAHGVCHPVYARPSAAKFRMLIAFAKTIPKVPATNSIHVLFTAILRRART